MSDETRKDQRAKVLSLNVRYKSATVDEFIEHHSHDISKGGIFIKTPNPFNVGTLLKFEIRIKDDQALISGVGRVVWKRESTKTANEKPAGMGVKFIKLDPASRELIERVIAHRKYDGPAFEETPDGEAPASSRVSVSQNAPTTVPTTAATLGSTFFPTGGAPAEQPPPGERTVIKQANEILADALKGVGLGLQSTSSTASSTPSTEATATTANPVAPQRKATLLGMMPVGQETVVATSPTANTEEKPTHVSTTPLPEEPVQKEETTTQNQDEASFTKSEENTSHEKEDLEKASHSETQDAVANTETDNASEGDSSEQGPVIDEVSQKEKPVVKPIAIDSEPVSSSAKTLIAKAHIDNATYQESDRTGKARESEHINSRRVSSRPPPRARNSDEEPSRGLVAQASEGSEAKSSNRLLTYILIGATCFAAYYLFFREKPAEEPSSPATPTPVVTTPSSAAPMVSAKPDASASVPAMVSTSVSTLVDAGRTIDAATTPSTVKSMAPVIPTPSPQPTVIPPKPTTPPQPTAAPPPATTVAPTPKPPAPKPAAPKDEPAYE